MVVWQGECPSDRVQWLAKVRFERGTVATPELLQDIELPSSISVLGQPVDLTNLKASPSGL